MDTSKISIKDITATTATVVSSDSNVYKGSVPITYSVSNFIIDADLSVEAVTDFAQTSDGTIYVTTQSSFYSSGSVYKKAPSDSKFTKVSGIDNVAPVDILLLPDDTIVIGVINNAQYQGAVYRKAPSATSFSLVATFAGQVRKLIYANETIYVATWSGLNQCKVYEKDSGGSTFRDITGAATGQVETLVADLDGTIWIGTWTATDQDKVYRRDVGGDFREVTGTQGKIETMIIDSYKTIWVGTSTADQQGVLTGKVFKKNYYEQNFDEVAGTQGQVQSLLVINDTIYAGTYAGLVDDVSQGNLYKKSISNEDAFTIVSKIPSSDIRYLASDNRNNLYVGAWTGGNNSKLYKSSNGIDFKELVGFTDQVRGIWQDTSGTIWLAVWKSVATGTMYKSERV